MKAAYVRAGCARCSGWSEGANCVEQKRALLLALKHQPEILGHTRETSETAEFTDLSFEKGLV